NLSKFDKRAVFDQIRNEDTTADEDRLVSFNRLPQTRPGTYGGMNLHPTENVLESARSLRRSEESSESEEDAFEFDSGGRNSRRAMSRTSIKRNPLRSSSGRVDDDGSHPSSTGNLLSRSRGSIARPIYTSSPQVAASPLTGRISPPPISPSHDKPTSTTHFRLASNNHFCPTITPGAMSNIQEVAELEFGLSPDILNENAGRGLAEVALMAINPGGRRLARENLKVNARPVLVVLVGNHKAGARAVAAARHLLSRGPRVIACILGLDRQSMDMDVDLRRQSLLFQRMGGTLRGWAEVSKFLKRLDAPPELIVDALLSPGRTYDGLNPEDQAVCLEMLGWANKSHAQVLAVDCPSGINQSTGETSMLEGEPLEVRAKFVACVGAPRLGLLRAMQRIGEHGDRRIWVVDVGLNKAWKESGIRGRAGVRFGSEWVVPLRVAQGQD
ncbi:hypothetical protein LTS18_009442, partial [Coniosporium uncinatum]